MPRDRFEEKETTNSSVDRKIRWFDLSCPLCPPNRCENAKHKGKHGRTKPRYKDKRK